MAVQRDCYEAVSQWYASHRTDAIVRERNIKFILTATGHVKLYTTVVYRYYVIVITPPGVLWLVYSQEPEGAKRPRASDCKPATARLGGYNWLIATGLTG